MTELWRKGGAYLAAYATHPGRQHDASTMGYILTHVLRKPWTNTHPMFPG